MILVLLLAYLMVLGLLVKLNVIKMTLWWKISPVVWVVFLLVALFIPMQFWAPSGQALVFQYSVPIVPNVAGQVVTVPIEANANLKKGDTLFTIDTTPYIAARDQVEAQLELARISLAQTQELASRNLESQMKLDQDLAQVKQLEASLLNAEYNLEQTTVRAPADGFVTNLALRPGARVSPIPLAQTMAFVENAERVIVAQIPQGYLRLIKPGQSAEVTFKLFPGKIFNASVEYVIKASAAGQVMAGGSMVAAQEISTSPFAVRLRLDDQNLMDNLPAGATADIAIYTESGKATHVIRKVMIRQTAILNYIKPY